MPPPTPYRRAWLLRAAASLLGLTPTTALADNTSTRLSNAELEGAFVFVPPLDGELMLGMGLDARRTDGFRGGGFVPEVGPTLRLGYRRYGEDWGRIAWGGYAFGGWAPEEGVTRGSLLTAGLGGSFQLRGMNDQFFFALIGVFAEAGVAGWGAPPVRTDLDVFPPEELQRDAVGWRWAAGLELGLGMMGWLDPYIYGEIPIWGGVESVDLGIASWTTVLFGVAFRVDLAHR